MSSKRIIYDAARVGEFVARKFDCSEFHSYSGIGLESDGELLVGVVYEKYTGPDITMHVAAVDGRRWLTRELLREAFYYPFIQLECERISAEVSTGNLHTLAFNLHLGFEVEGTRKHAYLDGDAIQLVLWAAKCRFINQQGEGKWVDREEESFPHRRVWEGGRWVV